MLCLLLSMSLIILIKVIILVFLMYQYMLNHENDVHYRFLVPIYEQMDNLQLKMLIHL
jgi:hypothetical protein